jgi:23S rRNA pseudouridine955/2504/2580 synthase
VSVERKFLPLGEHDEGRRLDRILRRLLGDVSLGRIYTLIRKGGIRVSGKRRAASYRIERGDILELPEEIAPAHAVARGDVGTPGAPNAGGRIPPELADRVIYENEHILAVDKPAGMPVHGEDGLLAALRPYLEGGARKSISFRPGPIHRLDRNTSGLMLFPRSLRGSQRASELLRAGRLVKGYLAVLSGRLSAIEVWEDTLERDRSRNVTRVTHVAPGGQAGAAPRGGADKTAETGDAARHARSVAAPLYRGASGTGGDAGVTLALIRIETGRTHQIRAQAEAHGYPLIGDTKYGGHRGREGGAAGPADVYFLHAAVLINRDPDQIFPEAVICAPPRGERRRALATRLGVSPTEGERAGATETGLAPADAASPTASELDAALACPALSDSLLELVYKESGNQ